MSDPHTGVVDTCCGMGASPSSSEGSSGGSKWTPSPDGAPVEVPGSAAGLGLGLGLALSPGVTVCAKFEVNTCTAPLQRGRVGCVRPARRHPPNSQQEWDLVAKVYSSALCGAWSQERRNLQEVIPVHDHIVSLVGDTHLGPQPCLLFPRFDMDGVELYEVAVRQAGGVTEAMVRPVFRAVAMALAHLHAHGVVHMDVKPENVLLRGLEWPSGRVGQVVLADLGDALAVNADTRWYRCNTRGTKYYQAPELVDWSVNRGYMTRTHELASARHRARRIVGGAVGGAVSAAVAGAGGGSAAAAVPAVPGVADVPPVPTLSLGRPALALQAPAPAFDLYALDVWAAGSTLFAWLTGTMLIIGETGETPATYFGRTGRCAGVRQWSQPLQDLLVRMLDSDFARRPTMDQVLSHPWVWSAADHVGSSAAGSAIASGSASALIFS